MQFSIWPSYDRSWEEILDLATYAERTGWHGFWAADHFMTQTDDDTVGLGPALECWTVLTAIGAMVPRLRLTSMVSPVTIHHPIVLAKRVTTLDHITDGRVTLGLGAGWQVNEHVGYGFDLPAPGERVSRFEEALQVVHHLLRDERTEFAGRYYRVTDAPFEPKPVQSPLPILVGTGSPRMMHITARWADEWNTWGDPEQLTERTAAFTAACDDVDRDPAGVRRSAQAMFFITDDPMRRDKLRQRAPAGRSLVGSTTELLEMVGAYVALGVDELAIPDFTLGKSVGERRENYERLHTEVLSAFT
jgi:alkanesulfonate monooxygenase SsuD/methylene tetrahydromethanopterin reductase-like flavin-dependent oxidoreductase (luciferase family)